MVFCSRQANNMINKLHERALRFVLNNHVGGFEALLRKSNDVSYHHRNIPILMIELYKIKNELAPPIMDSTEKHPLQFQKFARVSVRKKENCF